MSTIERAEQARHQQHNNSDIVRGAEGIAQALNLPRRSVEHMLARGYLKSPVRIGHSWFASRSKLLSEFVGE